MASIPAPGPIPTITTQRIARVKSGIDRRATRDEYKRREPGNRAPMIKANSSPMVSAKNIPAAAISTVCSKGARSAQMYDGERSGGRNCRNYDRKLSSQRISRSPSLVDQILYVAV